MLYGATKKRRVEHFAAARRGTHRAADPMSREMGWRLISDASPAPPAPSRFSHDPAIALLGGGERGDHRGVSQRHGRRFRAGAGKGEQCFPAQYARSRARAASMCYASLIRAYFWRMSGHPAVQQALRNPFFDGLGLPRLYLPAHA